ncbi:hypothetical protein GCK32_003495 [Trichostrongylus colubriformis]|uniref:Uncharacterized protein n=1 Tax=Trichostrongylus colubriformis TaxID=6319 RepID=A0AAN8G092_TRICO
MYDEIVQPTEQRPLSSTTQSSRMDASPSTSHHAAAPPPYTARSTRLSILEPFSSCSLDCNPVLQHAVVLLLYSVLFLAAAVACAVYFNEFLSHYPTLWTGVMSLINSLIGVIAGVSKNDRFLIAHLLLSMASIVAYAACGVICWKDFLKIGTVAWCEDDSYFCDNTMFCLLPAYNQKRIRHIYNYTRYGDFTVCANHFKIGTSLPLVLLIGAGAGVVLSVIAAANSFSSIRRWSKLSITRL